MSKGLIFAISAPSGTGKTTVSERIIWSIPNVVRSVSFNTREKRPSEIDGVDYIFMSNEEFDVHVKNENLIEYTEIYNARRGTPKAPLLANQQNNIDTICVIEWNGTKCLKEQFGGTVVSIYLFPPSIDVLAERLTLRGQDSKENIKLRMQNVHQEMTHAAEY
ncbi:MAG: hypothetical protein LBQ43_05075, partial [Holosporales bacterium]|nr:hypothetical protein [Holosporales bacterium]